MHVLYVHPNFPAQFGHIANHLVRKLGWRCTFVSQTPSGNAGGIEKINYKLEGGARAENHFCTRTFENSVWHCDGVYKALKARPDVKPDLIVGHSGFGTTLFLRELYPQTPVVNLFEYYYRPHGPDSDMDFRKDLAWKVPEEKYLRARCRNAMILLDLQNCQLGYCPTAFQRSRFPSEYAAKLRIIFDGVDRLIYHGHRGELRKARQSGPSKIAGRDVSPNTRIVTYVSRGFESMRGFDIFMHTAKRIAQEYSDVLFFVVGTERIAYGGDEDYLAGEKNFKDWVLKSESFDLAKFIFTGRLQPTELARLLALTDLHIYLTVPFVLSWSLMDALSCGAVVLGSATPPVMEMIRDGETGLLADFFNIDALAAKALEVLRSPADFRALGEAAEQMISQRYSLDVVIPQMINQYEEATRLSASPIS